MIFHAARAAIGQLFTAPFRAVFLKSLGLTILTLVALWFGLRELFDWLALPFIDALLPGFPSFAGWLGLIATILAAVGLAIGLAILVAPVSSLVAGFFLDDIAELVERESYPALPPGRPLPAIRSYVLSMQFFAVVVIANLVALFLLLVPLVNVGAFFVANGYLLGREFFEFAAMRQRPEREAKALRRKYALTVFLAGLVIAGFLAVPLLNLLTPLFATAMMVHLNQLITARESSAVRRG